MMANYCTRGRGNRRSRNRRRRRRRRHHQRCTDDGCRGGQHRLLPRPSDVAWPARRLVVPL